MSLDTRLLDACFEAAYKAGVEKEQLVKFLTWGYVPQPKQLQVHALARQCDSGDFDEIGLGGARGGSKSHTTFAQMCDDATRAKNLKLLLLRSVGKAAAESMNDLRLRVLRFVPHVYSRGVLSFENGSTIRTGHFRRERDIDNYIGIEYDGIGTEESTLISAAYQDRIRGSLRTSKGYWNPRRYHTTNPGGIGHKYFKDTFIKPYRAGKENETRFVPMSYKDNKYLQKRYVQWLEGLRGVLGKQWRDGDWDLAAGVFYDSFSEKSVAPQSALLQGVSDYWLSHDWGNNHPAITLLWGARGEQKAVLKEWRHRKTPPAEIAESIMAGCGALGVPTKFLDMFCGGDVFAEHVYGENTVGAIYERCGLSPRRADCGSGSVVRSAQKVLSALADGTLVIAKECENLIDCIENLPCDNNNSEKPMKVNADEFGVGGDDASDALRYGIDTERMVVL